MSVSITKYIGDFVKKFAGKFFYKPVRGTFTDFDFCLSWIYRGVLNRIIKSGNALFRKKKNLRELLGKESPSRSQASIRIKRIKGINDLCWEAYQHAKKEKMIGNNQIIIFDKSDHPLPKGHPAGKVYYKKVGKEIKRLYGVEVVHVYCTSDKGCMHLGSEMIHEGEGELTASRRLLKELKGKQKKNRWRLPPASTDRAYIDHEFINGWDEISYGSIGTPKKNMVCLKDALGMLDQAIESGKAEREDKI